MPPRKKKSAKVEKQLPPMTEACSICAKEFAPGQSIAYKDGWSWFCADHALNGFNFSGTLEDYRETYLAKQQAEGDAHNGRANIYRLFS